MRQRIHSYVPTIEVLFKLSYLCLVLSTFNTFIYTSPIQSMLVKLTLGIGLVLFVVRICFFKEYVGMPCFWAMVLYCVSFVITAVYNHGYGGLTGNGKWIVWTGIQFFLLYVGTTKSKEIDVKKEFTILANVMVAYGFVAAVISLKHLVTNTSYLIQTAEGELIIGGFQWGRLWGVYIDPNYGSIFSVIVIVLALFLQKNKGKLWKAGYIAVAIVNVAYLIFSDSRSGEIAFICCGIFLILGHLVQGKGNTVQAKNIIRYFLVALAFSLVSVGGFTIVKSGYNKQLAPVFAKKFPEKVIDTRGIQKRAKRSKAEIGRKKDLAKNISNGRLAIWQSSLEIWKTTPVLGAGYTTMLARAKEQCPDTYMVKMNYESVHNSFLNVLLYQGIVGGILFLLILIKNSRIVIIQLIKQKGAYGRWVWYTTTCIGAVLIGMLFLTEGIYTNSVGAFVLWTFLGYIVRGSMREQEKLSVQGNS